MLGYLTSIPRYMVWGCTEHDSVSISHSILVYIVLAHCFVLAKV